MIDKTVLILCTLLFSIFIVMLFLFFLELKQKLNIIHDEFILLKKEKEEDTKDKYKKNY